MYKNLNVVYDDMDEIFYNNKYLDILKSKDYVMELENEKIDIEFKIVDNGTETKQKVEKSNKEKLFDVMNQTKIISYANAKKDFWKFKYLIRRLCHDKCVKCSIECLSYNYMIKKYTKQKLDDSNILIILDIPGNWNFYTVETKDMIFENYAYYLFNNLKNANIYMIICGKDMKKYKSKVVNKKNNNTCYLLTQGTDGSILNRKTFDMVVKKLDDIEIDTVFIDSINISNKLQNIKTLITYIYIILYFSNRNTILLFELYLVQSINYELIILFNYFYNNVLLVKNKISDILFSNIHIICKNPLKNKIKFIKKLLESYIDIQYTKKVFKIYNFLDNLYNITYSKNLILVSIIDKKYENPEMYNIIKQTIKIKQIHYAHKKKYKKYLLPN
jgi:hypothetical protein